MARPATARLKCNPPLGRMPVLQYLRPEEIDIDPSYQRSIEAPASQTLIRKIAQHWNWDLCQPLVVASRPSGALMVIDGQHRLAAARLRGDIDQMPCTIVHYASAADEAASFVHLNQQRRPLTRIELFKAAVASEDPEAGAIAAAMAEAGLTLALHSNYMNWKPGMVHNIGGIERAWRKHGRPATTAAMKVLAHAYPRETLRYAGSIFPGVVAVCTVTGVDLDRLINVIRGKSQEHWRNAILRAKANDANLNFEKASVVAVMAAWRKIAPAVGTQVDESLFREGRAWCEQCDMRVTIGQATTCKIRHCRVRKSA